MKNSGYFFILVLLLVTMKVSAALGGHPTSIGLQSSNSHPLYRINFYELTPKITIQEYISTETGIVFAVIWKGPVKPNLRQLLGRYYPILLSELNKPHNSHMPVFINKPSVVIESGGHPHSFFGRAYLPSALPEGMNEAEFSKKTD